jgi:Ca2+:H+ antiporter
MRWFLLFVPLSIVLHFMHVPPVWLFVVSALAIVPLAGQMSMATEELAKYRGQSIGGLLNATFGNATELIICIVALQKNELEIVKSSLIGSILGNILLVMGLSMFLGGLKHKVQSCNKDVAQAHATMLALAAISLLVPALFVRSTPGAVETAMDPNVEYLSLTVAGVLIAIYLGGLIFSLFTHEKLFRSDEGMEEEPAVWSQGKALMILLISTAVIAFESELLVGSVEPVVHQWGISKIFVGIILVPIIGNAAEHSTAVVMALRNKMDISLNIAISSSTQIALFVAPVCVFISLAFGHPLTFIFSNFELIAVAAAIAIAVLISMDGKSHWLEGAQLLATYIILGLAFFFIAGRAGTAHTPEEAKAAPHSSAKPRERNHTSHALYPNDLWILPSDSSSEPVITFVLPNANQRSRLARS